MAASRSASAEQDGEPEKLPLHEDIMQLSRLGEIGPISELFTDGKFTAAYTDAEGITPLHWAAINNHYSLCKYLIDQGADVNAKGGEAVATPAMWAVQKCRIYIVHLLLEHGADPLLTDVQGYNMLHLAVTDGNAYMVLLLLHQNIPIDSPDPVGHTSLMWAAYKGFPACVELLLLWGASINAKDSKGFTALHWSLVKGNYLCIYKLIDSGADRFAETGDGKPPNVVAFEMKTKGPWQRALRDLGYHLDASAKSLPLPFATFLQTRLFQTRFFFLFPFFMLFVAFHIMSSMVIYVAVPLAAFIVYSLQYLAQQVLSWAPSDMKHLHLTVLVTPPILFSLVAKKVQPYLSGVFSASVFWAFMVWLRLLPLTYSHHPLYNLVFLMATALLAYFYMLSMTEDPGYVPKLSSRSSQKEVIDELCARGRYDEQNYCITCMIRVPVRTKHCRRCSRCVVKHDHHCPWIHNCVGVNNQRHFFIYVILLAVTIPLFLRIVAFSLELLPSPHTAHCNILPDSVCEYLLRDPMAVVVAIWAGLQLIWVLMLLVTQFVLISRALTTWESMRGHAHGMSPISQTVTSITTAGTTSLESAQITAGPSQSSRTEAPARKSGYLESWTKLLGLDSFLATTTGKVVKRGNPYSRGIVTNCKDFWCDPAPVFTRRQNGDSMLDGLAINYSSMYEPPSMMRMRRGMADGNVHYESVNVDDHV